VNGLKLTEEDFKKMYSPKCSNSFAHLTLDKKRTLCGIKIRWFWQEGKLWADCMKCIKKRREILSSIPPNPKEVGYP